MAPDGWREISMGKLVERVANPVDVTPDITYQEIGIRSHGKGLFDKEPVLGRALGNKRVFWVEPNCFVVNIVFAWEQAVGRTTNRDKGKIASHRFPMYRPKLGQSDVDFLAYLFKTPYGKHLLALASPGGAGRNKTLGQSEFLKISVRVPHLNEQRRIAEILSTWDSAIEVVEKLISNSRLQKWGLMQQLLTGKKRISGFNGEWKLVPIRQMGKVIGGGTPDSDNAEYWNGDILWATPTDITCLNSRYICDTARKISKEGLAQSAAKLLPIGAILVCTRATIGELAIAAAPISTNQGFKSVIPNKDHDSDFLFYLLQFNKHVLVRYASGSTFAEISKHDFEKRSFYIPGLDEQRAIAATLANCDDQPPALVRQSQILRSVKRALMQQLLTGKRRVKIEEKAA